MCQWEGQWFLCEFSNHLPECLVRAPLSPCKQPGLVLTLFCIANLPRHHCPSHWHTFSVFQIFGWDEEAAALQLSTTLAGLAKCLCQPPNRSVTEPEAIGVPGWQTDVKALCRYSQSPQACKPVHRAPTWLTTAFLSRWGDLAVRRCTSPEGFDCKGWLFCSSGVATV